MLRDDSGNGGGRPSAPRNVLGERLDVCSMKPKTGFFRDGCCNTGREDAGSHTVCAVMTAAFLEFSKSCGNDLSTPMPEFGFPGLRPGDRWCLCAPRWREAMEAGYAPRVVLRATHERALGTARSPISSVSRWISPDLRHRTRRAHALRGARGDEFGGASSSPAPLGPRPSAAGWRPPNLAERADGAY